MKDKGHHTYYIHYVNLFVIQLRLVIIKKKKLLYLSGLDILYVLIYREDKQKEITYIELMNSIQYYNNTQNRI